MILSRAEQMLNEAGIEISLSSEQHSAIQDFLIIRSSWNKTHNLIGPAADKDPWNMDVSDAAALSQIYKTGLNLYDVGSGSGVPGLIFGILRPEVSVHVVEPLTKRVAFLKTVITKLGLENIKVHRKRWPLMGEEPCQVVSRAVVSPETWPALANSRPSVQRIYRYLARNRAAFDQEHFQLATALDYRRSGGESLRIERWDRTN